MRNLLTTFFMIGVLLTGIATGCSGGGVDVLHPVEPGENFVSEEGQADRHLWGMWGFEFDSSNQSITLAPIRNNQFHLDVTSLVQAAGCDECVDVHVNQYDPNTGLLDIDITLRNKSDVTGKDVRGLIYSSGSSTFVRRITEGCG